MKKIVTPEAIQNDILSTTERVEDATNVALRKLDEVGKNISALDGDRELMEKHQATLTETKELLRFVRQSIEESERQVKFEIKEIQLRMDSLEKMMKEILDKLDTKKVIKVKERPSWMFWRRGEKKK